MATPSLSIRVLRVVAASILVAAAGWYSPLVTAAGWHLFHPRGWILYSGLHVAVPWPWTADVESLRDDPAVNPQGLSLKKTPYTLDRRLTNQAIFVTVMSLDPGSTAQRQTEGWMGSFRATHPGSEFDAKAPAAIPAGASCLGARSHWNQSGIVWTCISVDGGWVADFEGQSTDAAVFFEIIGQLRGKK